VQISFSEPLFAPLPLRTRFRVATLHSNRTYISSASAPEYWLRAERIGLDGHIHKRLLARRATEPAEVKATPVNSTRCPTHQLSVRCSRLPPNGNVAKHNLEAGQLVSCAHESERCTHRLRYESGYAQRVRPSGAVLSVAQVAAAIRKSAVDESGREIARLPLAHELFAKHRTCSPPAWFSKLAPTQRRWSCC